LRLDKRNEFATRRKQFFNSGQQQGQGDERRIYRDPPAGSLAGRRPEIPAIDAIA